MFSWIPIYKEIANKVLTYENNQSELIKIISDLQDKGIPTIKLTNRSKNGKEIPLTELDGFTFFANFNRVITDENRTAIIEHLKEIWQLEAEVPTEFAGIPLVNNMNSWFFADIDDKKKEDIALLWKLYKELVTDKIQEDTFNKVFEIKFVNKKVTLGCFWIRPDKYISVDKTSKQFLKKNGINPTFSDYKSYMKILNEASEKINKEFFELSYEAWQDTQKKGVTPEEVDIQKDNDKEKKLENLPLNLILYGPPGTGKTYKIQNEYIPLFTDKTRVKTKSEYLAELVEELGWFTSIVLTMMDKEKMTVPEIVATEAIQIKSKISRVKNVNANIWGHLQRHTKMNCPNVRYINRSWPVVFWKEENSTWEIDKKIVEQELPEVYEQWQKLKSFNPVEEEEKRYNFITFHQSFSYEDFIEGIKPKINQNLDDGVPENDNPYVIEPGIFLKIATKASLNPDKKWALFIDEINRGNVASIFGELITLIEKDKRDKLPAKLPYSKKDFVVPKNLYIIGTMNTTDRSIEALDAALRRRFSFIEVVSEPGLLSQSKMLVEDIDLEKMLETINKRIGVLLDKDHLIGHSYFMKIVNKSNPLEEIKEIFLNNLIPLLEEYFYGDRAKIKMLLGPAFVKEEQIEDKDIDFFLIENNGNEGAYENYTYEITIPETLKDFRSIYEKSNSDI